MGSSSAGCGVRATVLRMTAGPQRATSQVVSAALLRHRSASSGWPACSKRAAASSSSRTAARCSVRARPDYGDQPQRLSRLGRQPTQPQRTEHLDGAQRRRPGHLDSSERSAAVLLAADVGRGRYLDSLQQDGLPRTAVASMFDALVEPLQSLSWTVLIAGLVVAGVAVLGSRGWTTGAHSGQDRLVTLRPQDFAGIWPSTLPCGGRCRCSRRQSMTKLSI